MALAIVERAREDRHRAVLLETDAAHLRHWPGGRLKEAADTEAAQQAFPGACGFASGKAVHIGQRQRVVQHAREIAGIVDNAARRLERNLLRRDLIAPPELDR